MNRRNISSNSTIFYKLYGVNLIITVVFVCLIAILCSVFSSKLILNNMITFHKGLIAEKRNTLDGRVNQLDETVNLMLGEENVFRLLTTDEDDYEKHTMFLRIIRHFQNICYNNSLVTGVSLVDVKRGIVITDKTKMSLEEAGGYERYQRQSSFLVTEGEDGKQLEYVKRFEPVWGEKEIYIILTVDREAFMNNLLMGGGTEMMTGYLMTNGGDILSLDGADSLSAEVKEQFKTQGNQVWKFRTKDQNLVLYRDRSQVSDISVLAVQDYTGLLQEADTVTRMIVIASVVMIMVASVIIYLCSLYAYKPLKQLGNRVRGLALKDGQVRVKNEYNLIEHVVTELQNEKEYTMPSVVRDSIGRLVTDAYDGERFEYLKAILHQKMAYERSVLVVTECDMAHANQLVAERFQEMIGSCGDIEGFFIDMTAVRCVGIFNTSLNYEQFLGQIGEQKQRLSDESDVCVTCCVSRGFTNWENLNLIYSETLRNLERKFFKGKNTIIYETAPLEAYKNEFYNKEIEKRLITYVTEGACKEAMETLGRLTENLSSYVPDIQYTRFVYFQICNNLMRSVLELGGKLPKEYNEKNVFEKVFQAESIQELERMAEQILHVCMSNFGSRDKAYSKNVEKTIAVLKEKYMLDLSMDDVAGEIFISSGYLSIIFKEETGYTVMEYLTDIRMRKAKELLTQTPLLKVKEISERLGYNRVQSFIRYFKKYYGETPVNYRKNLVRH